VNAGRRHLQLPRDGPEAKPLGFQLLDLSDATIDGGRSAKLDATLPSSRQTGVEVLLDNATLELGHGHQDAKLEPSSRVVIAGVDALAASNPPYPQPVRVVED